MAFILNYFDLDNSVKAIARFLLVYICVFYSLPSLGQSGNEAPTDGLWVEKRNMVDIDSDYSERRRTWGAYFGVNVHYYNPSLYDSVLLVNDFGGDSFDNIFEGSPSKMVEINLGGKFNMGPLSLGFGGVAGTSDNSVSDPLSTFNLNIRKLGVTGRIAVDGIFDEPWVVPYLDLEYYNMSFTEDYSSDSDTYQTGWGLATRLGLLVSINWLDAESAREARFNLGLKNTFLDLFAIKYENTSDELDPATETDFDFGLGLGWEF